WRAAAKFRYFLGRLVSRIERRPDRPWRNGIHPDPPGNEVGCKRPSECVDAALCHGIIQQALVAEESGHRTGHDDRPARPDMWHRRPRHIEVPVQVRFNCLVEMLVTEIDEVSDVL